MTTYFNKKALTDGTLDEELWQVKLTEQCVVIVLPLKVKKVSQVGLDQQPRERVFPEMIYMYIVGEMFKQWIYNVQLRIYLEGGFLNELRASVSRMSINL